MFLFVRETVKFTVTENNGRFYFLDFQVRMSFVKYIFYTNLLQVLIFKYAIKKYETLAKFTSYLFYSLFYR